MMTTQAPIPPRVVAAQRFQRRFAAVMVAASLLSHAPLLLLSVNEPLAIGLWIVAMIAGLAGPALLWQAPAAQAKMIVDAWKVARHDQLVTELRHEARIAAREARIPPPLRLRV